MKTSLEHLPLAKQREIARVVDVIQEEFADSLNGTTSGFKKRGRILKIILFGSYARNNWVDEPHTKKGYKSDFDLLIIVNDKKLTDMATYWHKTQDRLLHVKGVSTPVGLIVHSRREVNTSLREGLYFFVEIVRDGICLYELDDEPLATPQTLTAEQAYEQATRHFAARDRVVDTFVESAVFRLEKQDLPGTAFMLHQARPAAMRKIAELTSEWVIPARITMRYYATVASVAVAAPFQRGAFASQALRAPPASAPARPIIRKTSSFILWLSPCVASPALSARYGFQVAEKIDFGTRRVVPGHMANRFGQIRRGRRHRQEHALSIGHLQKRRTVLRNDANGPVRLMQIGESRNCGTLNAGEPCRALAIEGKFHELFAIAANHAMPDIAAGSSLDLKDTIWRKCHGE